MEVIGRGILKREVGKLEIKDYSVSKAVIDALLEKGFDLISAPLVDGKLGAVGEVITIYKKIL